MSLKPGLTIILSIIGKSSILVTLVEMTVLPEKKLFLILSLVWTMTRVRQVSLMRNQIVPLNEIFSNRVFIFLAPLEVAE